MSPVVETIEVLRDRVETFRRLAAEQAIPVVVDDPVPLPRNPALPVGLYDVFDLVGAVDPDDPFRVRLKPRRNSW